VIDNPEIQHKIFNKKTEGLSFKYTTNNASTSSRLTRHSSLDMEMQENSFESILDIPDDFNWELFDTQIRPQVAVTQDRWSDLNTADLEMGMDTIYDL
jgi:hypothetical protein